MFDYLQIYEPTERLLVGCADTALGALAAPLRVLPRRRPTAPPGRILLLRLERIGDLLMAMPALEAMRERARDATIHLVVGSWNAAVAELLPWIDSHETLDAPWLARHTGGNTMRALARRAWSWRARKFDLALNFEPDIRSNLLLGLSGAPRRVGFRSGGGKSLLTDAFDYDPRRHTAANLRRLVDAALPATGQTALATHPRLRIPAAARQQADVLLRNTRRSLMIGIHVSGGRAIKQWPLDRFVEVALRLAREHQATIVFTGAQEDRPLVEQVIAALPSDVPRCNVVGDATLQVAAAVLEQLDLFITGDTGPMHLAAAVGTPIVAIFGASDPVRYGPLADHARVVTANLWCRPCNRIRRPPARCTVGAPDCLNAVSVDAVINAASDLLGAAT